jgi:hypothetical protein
MTYYKEPAISESELFARLNARVASAGPQRDPIAIGLSKLFNFRAIFRSLRRPDEISAEMLDELNVDATIAIRDAVAAKRARVAK